MASGPVVEASNGDCFDLGLYQQRDPLGEGSFGRVFKYEKVHGTDEDPTCWVAVKEVLVSEDSEVKRKSIQREQLIMQKHRHKNIVSYLGIARRPGMAYFVMELCTTNLRQFRKGRILIKEEISVIIKEVLTGLVYLHKNNVIHRDVKPGNILVKTHPKNTDMKTVHIFELEIKLCDFGLSRPIHSLSKTVTLTMAGTEEYMPPEARGDLAEKNPTTHSTGTFDTFSAGVVTHELATGILHRDVTEYTDFEKMRKNLGQNCEGEGDFLFSFLKDMLHYNKKLRKEPKDLLSHPFIHLGECYLEKEKLKLITIDEGESKIQELQLAVNETKQSMEKERALNQSVQEQMKQTIESIRNELALTQAKNVSLGKEIKALKEKVTMVKESQPISRTRRETYSGMLKPDNAATGARMKTTSLNNLSIPTDQQQSDESDRSPSPGVSVTTKHFLPVRSMNSRLRASDRRTVTRQRKVNDDLWQAAKLGDTESLKLALTAGAQLEYKRSWGQSDDPTTALHEAADSGHLSATDVLLKAGSNIDAVTEKELMTPLMFASMQGHQNVVKLLLRNKANVNQKCNDGLTALHFAAYNSHFPTCKLLFAVGKADINVKDNQGDTPLVVAGKGFHNSEEHKEAVIKYLLIKGATE